MDTLQFISENRCQDVKRLALSHIPQGVDLQYALIQIAGYQIAAQKLPRWAACDGIIYPKHLSMEQCTSQSVSMFKADLVKELLKGRSCPLHYADLTGGFGVDCFFLSEAIRSLNSDVICRYNEMNPELCQIAGNNFPLLGQPDIRISEGTAEEFISKHRTERFDLIYLDPARRDAKGGKVVSIRDCQPDVSVLQDDLLDMSRYVVVKLSPMLDLTRLLSELKSVISVTVISLDGECKELLVTMSNNHAGDSEIGSVNIDSKNGPGAIIKATLSKELSLPIKTAAGAIAPGTYLHEPYACHMKSGLFRTLQHRYGVQQLDVNTHLFWSETPSADFPGRTFRINVAIPADRHSLKQFFSHTPQANIAVRNFPMTVAEIRQRYKVRDGGNHYVFLTSAQEVGRILLDCERL